MTDRLILFRLDAKCASPFAFIPPDPDSWVADGLG